WENCMMRTNGGDWIMMMRDEGSSSSSTMVQYCRKRPLKTLQLFPVATTGFKD
ncbi:hypothetical protein HAX54_047895, partial [Datura stramonium]|nr:hypothetical protein [Datura stramonium]